MLNMLKFFKLVNTHVYAACIFTGIFMVVSLIIIEFYAVKIARKLRFRKERRRSIQS